MKNGIFLLILLFNITFSFSQNIFFGYPISETILNKGDVIILNMPDNVDGRFNESIELDSLIGFINKYSKLIVCIEINCFYGSSEYNETYSQSMTKNLINLLKERCKGLNYKIISNGSRNPIILDKDSSNYRKINTRIEIIIE